MLTVAVFPGDGVGNEVISEAVKVLKTVTEITGVDFQYETYDYGAGAYLRTGKAFPNNVREIVQDVAKKVDAILCGPGGEDPRVPPGNSSPVVSILRSGLDLYAMQRPCKLFDARLSPLNGKNEADVDFVVFREATEGLYSGLGGNFKRGTPDEVAIREEICTWKGVYRVIKYAFEYAKKHNLTRVTVAEKTGEAGIWLRAFRQIAKDYPEIKPEDMHIDTMCYQMVMTPEHFQVIVTENMWGDIASDLASALHGGRGLSPSGCFSAEKKICYFAPTHGTSRGKVGKNLANPLASILSGQMMLEHFGLQGQADLVEKAVIKAVKERKVTGDIGGTLSTSQTGDFICQTIRELAA